MAIIIQARDCLTAWQNASNIIIQNGEQRNLIITIDNPCDFTDLNLWIQNRNPKSISSNHDNIRHVINTIFPYNLERLCNNRHTLYQKYKLIYQNGNNRSWGTYFQRLTSFDNHYSNNGINQLEDSINALNGGSQQKNYIVFHLSARNLDSNVRPMGAPCWHFGEISINGDRSLNLTAVYRKHDYYNKAFGNFIGLSKLLDFICRETGRTPGQLVIHSINAYNSSTNANLSQLII